MPLNLDAALGGDSRSRQTLAALFIDMVDSPDGPCPRPALAAFHLLRQDFSTPPTVNTTTRKYIKQRGDVMRASIRFVMAPRTPSGRECIWARTEPQPSHCTCNTQTPFLLDLHRHAEHSALGSDSRPMRRLFTTLLEDVGNTYDWLDRERLTYKLVRHAQSSSRSRGGRPWPLGPSDIAPYGVEASIANVCAWTDQMPTASVLDVAKLIWCIADQCTHPALLLSPIISDALPLVTNAIISRRSGGPEDLRSIRNGLMRPGALLVILRGIPTGVILRTLRDRPLIWRRFLVCAIEVSTALQPEHIKHWAIDALGRDQLSEVCGEYERCIARFYVILGPSTVADLPTPSSALFASLMEYFSMDITVAVGDLTGFFHFFHPSVYQACGNPGCARTRIERGGHMLRPCKGCNLVLYCSRTCQKAAWRHLQAPHRLVCPRIKALAQKVSHSSLQPTHSRAETHARAHAIEGYGEQWMEDEINVPAARRDLAYLTLAYTN